MATPSTSSARENHEQAGCRRHPPQGPGHTPKRCGHKRGPGGAHRGEAAPSPAQWAIPARRAATLRCGCQTATLAHLRARFDLATHSKTPAARLGRAARKAGSHLRLPRRSSWCGVRCTMTEQHLPSYERDFSEVQQLRDIAARFERAARHCFNSKVQRLRDIVERFEWVRLYSIRRRRTARIERITEIQRDKREWINFAEIAEYCSEESGIVSNEVAREAAYERLLADLLERDFEENGVSQIMYLHPYTSKTRMTREWMADLSAFKDADRAAIISQYLAPCWMPRA